MLFNSVGFLFLFLPVALGGYYGLLRLGLRSWIFLFLVAVSLLFYSVWNPPYVLLLLASMGLNYGFGLAIERVRAKGRRHGWILGLGVAANVTILGYYKYATFIIENVNALADTDFTLHRIILPLAISFYTFQQIAYLVDIARGEVKSGGVARFATFVIFFPQLIAGPIVHYKEMMPQFFGRNLGRFWRADIVIGLVIFGIGLFKKTVIADSAAGFSSPVFDSVAAGGSVDLFSAWKAAICYTFQLYFDFSGYSDMAVGLARMFGLLLPPNFHSPLRAASIIDYWRRWHITLQQFIVSYMFKPVALPLTRLAAIRGMGRQASFWLTTVVPTFIIFVVIGAWHGAAWTFILFGTMHGAYLSINELWRNTRRKARRSAPPPSLIIRVGYHALTLFAVVIANIVFRSESIGDAVTIWGSMLHLDEITAIAQVLPATIGELISEPFLFICVVSAIVAFAPNTQQLMRLYRPVLGWSRWKNVAPAVVNVTWRATAAWAVWTGVVLFFGLIFILRGQSEFIYFNF